MAYDNYVLLVGLTVGALIIYLALRSHFAIQVVGQAQRIASQMFESQRSQLDASIRQTYHAKLGEWKATRSAWPGSSKTPQVYSHALTGEMVSGKETKLNRE